MKHVIDITTRANPAAITALVTFGETVKTNAGRIEPTTDAFVLYLEGRKPRKFTTASGAVEVLRRASR